MLANALPLLGLKRGLSILAAWDSADLNNSPAAYLITAMRHSLLRDLRAGRLDAQKRQDTADDENYGFWWEGESVGTTSDDELTESSSDELTGSEGA